MLALTAEMRGERPLLTPMEIHLKILLIDIRRHGNDRRIRLHLADHSRCRDAIKLGHDNIHENQIIVVMLGVDFIHSF